MPLDRGPRNAPLRVAPIAAEIAKLIEAHQQNRRLSWTGLGSVKLMIGRIIPDNCPAWTRYSRRLRFKKALQELLPDWDMDAKKNTLTLRDREMMKLDELWPAVYGAVHGRGIDPAITKRLISEGEYYPRRQTLTCGPKAEIQWLENLAQGVDTRTDQARLQRVRVGSDAMFLRSCGIRGPASR
jgi:hypothetical protein